MSKISLIIPLLVLSACSSDLATDTDKDLSIIEWQATDNSDIYRYYHKATLLNDSRVLITGSYINENNVELFDPASLSFESTAPMTEGRSSHQAVKLNNGKVLVMGGYTKVQGNVNEIIAYSRSSEIFDPLTNTWEPSADLNEARSEFTATLLDNGSVLVTGGFNKNLAVSSAEIYDPATSEWRTIGSLNFKRGLHQAVTMNNGRVLLIGGSSADDKCEIFDPVSETFTIISPMKQSRAFHKAVKLDDGRVLVTGGNSTSSAEIYDPESDRWTEVTPMSIPRYKHSMTVLPDGKVLVTGGYGPLDTAMTYPTPILQSSTEIYDPETNSWQVSSPLKNARRSHTVTLLNSNQLLVVGGTQPQDDLSAELSTILDQ